MHQKLWLPPNSTPVGLQHLPPSARGELWELVQSQHSSEVGDGASLLGFVLSSLFTHQNKIKALSIKAVGTDTKITRVLLQKHQTKVGRGLETIEIFI